GRPNFRRGGAFAIVGTNGRAVPYAPAGSDAPTTTDSTADAASAGTPPDATGSGAAQGESSADIGAAATSVDPPGLPAVATYTYAVTGSERATGFGSRHYPPTMTVDVHTSPDLDA